jgi:hypothetical protein
MSSVRLGLQYAFDTGRIRLFAGAGGSYNIYKETWSTGGLSAEGKKFGFLANAGISLLFGRALSVFLRGEYLSVPTGAGGPLESRVNLGGIEGTLGLAVHF